MNYLDSHCHINGEEFNEDLDEVLNRMLENKVTKAMVICVSLEDYERTLKIEKEGIKFKKAIGVYPEYTNTSEEDFKKYVEYMKTCDAVGEIGLDYHWSPETKEAQKELFIRQIKIAKELNKPIIVHARDALQDTYDILKEYRHKGVLHCYSGSAEMAKEFVKLGYYISIAGPVTWKNAKVPLEVIKAIPLDHLLIETDCPYLTPAPNRGKRNEPSYVVHTAKKIMEELDVSEEEFLKTINENYDRLFNV
ncbi:MAG: TatD family hydrolase [Erysipelotrichaceae bacterium]|nr:TatD family hydrolase [Erysipelotrichaceae bacterium]